MSPDTRGIPPLLHSVNLERNKSAKMGDVLHPGYGFGLYPGEVWIGSSLLSVVPGDT